MKDLYLYINESILDIDDNIEHAGDIAVVKNFINENYTIRYYNGPADFDIRNEKTKDGKFIVDAQYCDVTVTNKDIKSLTNNRFVWGIVGNFYCKDCFKLKSLGDKSIDYQWCNETESLSRYQCMPYKLLDRFPQYNTIINSDEIIGSKEKYIMEDLGYFRVYRCGNSTWEWNHKSN